MWVCFEKAAVWPLAEHDIHDLRQGKQQKQGLVASTFVILRCKKWREPPRLGRSAVADAVADDRVVAGEFGEVLVGKLQLFLT